MKEGITSTKWILVLILISFLVSMVAAETAFSTGSIISISTSASVQGTVNETVSLTRSSIGGGIEKAELHNSYTSVNPSGLSWRSHLSVNSNEGVAWVDYSRMGGFPSISWRQFLGR
ncbi:MAG: hypothetical protein LUQ12_00455 [Methanoregulaceae archaeon]|nr:hypothetical protein [Methanoregulaceae archaeon]